MSESDILQFAGLTGDHSPIHTDEEFCRRGLYGTRVAHGPLGRSLAQGPSCRMSYLDGTALVSVGWDNWKFTGPTRIGDTITVHCRITSLRPRRRAGIGVVSETLDVRNQHSATGADGRSHLPGAPPRRHRRAGGTRADRRRPTHACRSCTAR
ncbi:MaoC family dehydratase [Actinophytocola sp.]|uniref:MaoC family dehydratase n=1 Tax=Actinophytocola sp. TaxID=1872138 RepID=UPI003D6AC217